MFSSGSPCGTARLVSVRDTSRAPPRRTARPTASLGVTLRVLAVVPARGGSAGVPLKNLAKVGGTPLVARAVASCVGARLIDEVVVSTDHEGIAAAATAAGAGVIHRPAELSGATASSESALLHALGHIGADPDVIVLVQCTSAFIDPADLDAAVAKVLDGSADVVFSGLPTHEFVWADRDGGVSGVNHDPASAPAPAGPGPRLPRDRRLLRHAHRRTARARAPVLRHRRSPAGSLAPRRSRSTPRRTWRSSGRWPPFVDRPGPLDVDAVVTDFDGVHTDDLVYVDQDGRETVAVSRSDGLGISLLKQSGVQLLVLSTERNPVVAARARKLGVPVLQGLASKQTALRDWLSIEGLDPARVAYAGNDLNDLGCMELVGWPVAVPDAHPRVRAAARIVLGHQGGAGAVRELCDRVARRAAGRRRARRPRPPRHAQGQGRPRSDRRFPRRPGRPVYVIGEIGINHNGDLDIARRLIDVAADAGCHAVKFQKRTPEICVPSSSGGQIRETPWGDMTYLEYRHRVEFERRRVRADRRVLRASAGSTGSRRRGTSPRSTSSSEFDAAVLQDRLGLADRRRAAAPRSPHRQADHPVDRHVDARRRSTTPSTSSAPRTWSCMHAT